MSLVDYTTSPLALLPAIIALSLAIISRKVLLSLSMGILSGALLLNNFDFLSTGEYLFTLVKGLFIDEGSINASNMSIVIFLILLGILTALMTLSGGTGAFVQWTQKRIKSKRGAKLLVSFFGVFIFVDDYFNSLAVGAVGRPITDKFKVSRAKLAYILDSTAAPMCIMTPISSWGASIITIIGGILLTHNIVDYTPLSAFVAIIPMNFYAIFALLMVFVVAWFQIDIGLMKRLEKESSEANSVNQDIQHQSHSAEHELAIVENEKGKVSDLMLPILLLIFSTVFWMIYSGAQSIAQNGQAFSILAAFENTNVGMSLLFGSSVSVFFALYTVLVKKIPSLTISKTAWYGAKSMLGAVSILLFAWAIGSIIKDMQTGKYLSSLLSNTLPVAALPVLLFLLSAIMAFSTGTSWGTFGIMLPIAGDFAAASDINMMLPALAAVLAGSVFGDHCSPISDTTILSSTGARCDHIQHVTSQLPYALIGAGVSSVSFVVLGLTGSTMLALGTGAAIFALLCFALRYIYSRPVMA